MKNIIKRIIVGVGIALILMLIKEHGLVLKAHALSCGYYSQTSVSMWSSAQQWTFTNNTQTSDAWQTIQRDTAYTIPWKSKDSYMIIKIPISYSIHAYMNTNSPNDTFLQMSDITPVLIGGNGAWYYGSYKNNFLEFTFFKEDFPNGVPIKDLRLSAPRFQGNWQSVQGWVKVEFFWYIEHYNCDSNEALEQAIDENTQAVQDTKDTIEDSSVDNDKASSDINTMNSKVASNGSITQLLTLPITLFQAILNSASGSCSSFNLGSLFNHNLTLPCINLENVLGSTLWGIIDMLCSGLFILSFRKKMVDIFNHMTSLNDRGNELE